MCDDFIIDITHRKSIEIEMQVYRNELELLVKKRAEELDTGQMTINPEPINIASLINEMHAHINYHLHDANKEYIGIGIAPTHLNVISHSFRQADLSTTRRYGGLGLAIAIARCLARLMGGDMTATSEGRGSRFVFTAGMHE